MSSPSRPVHPTRQQLDELEALMQRMLELPVHPSEDEADGAFTSTEQAPELESSSSVATSVVEPPLEGARAEVESMSAVDFAAPRLSWPEPTSPDPENEAPAAEPAPSWPKSITLVESPATSEQVNEPDVPASNSSAVAEAGWLPAQRLEPRVAPPELALPPPALWLRPLVWCNRGFDRLAGRLGAPGRWLLEPSGRAVLGWTGIALLLGAVAWGLLDWMGWTW